MSLLQVIYKIPISLATRGVYKWNLTHCLLRISKDLIWEKNSWFEQLYCKISALTSTLATIWQLWNCTFVGVHLPTPFKILWLVCRQKRPCSPTYDCMCRISLEGLPGMTGWHNKGFQYPCTLINNKMQAINCI